MQPDEVLFIRVHDSANDGRARLSFHTSFDNPLTPGRRRGKASRCGRWCSSRRRREPGDIVNLPPRLIAEARGPTTGAGTRGIVLAAPLATAGSTPAVFLDLLTGMPIIDIGGFAFDRTATAVDRCVAPWKRC